MAEVEHPFSLASRLDKAEARIQELGAENERLKEEAQARAWNAKEFTCEKCHTVVPWHEAKPGLYSPLCPYCDDGSSCLRSAEAIQRARADAAQQALATLRSKVEEWLAIERRQALSEGGVAMPAIRCLNRLQALLDETADNAGEESEG